MDRKVEPGKWRYFRAHCERESLGDIDHFGRSVVHAVRIARALFFQLLVERARGGDRLGEALDERARRVGLEEEQVRVDEEAEGGIAIERAELDERARSSALAA